MHWQLRLRLRLRLRLLSLCLLFACFQLLSRACFPAKAGFGCVCVRAVLFLYTHTSSRCQVVHTLESCLRREKRTGGLGRPRHKGSLAQHSTSEMEHNLFCLSSLIRLSPFSFLPPHQPAHPPHPPTKRTPSLYVSLRASSAPLVYSFNISVCFSAVASSNLRALGVAAPRFRSSSGRSSRTTL